MHKSLADIQSRYRGRPLAFVYRTFAYTVVRPSTAVQEDVQEIMPDLKLLTTDKFRGRLCVARGEAIWQFTLDVKEAFVTIATCVCEEAKNVELGVPARSLVLSAAQAVTTWLSCCDCTRQFMAEILVKDIFGRDVCGACHLREQGRIPDPNVRVKVQIRAAMAGESE